MGRDCLLDLKIKPILEVVLTMAAEVNREALLENLLRVVIIQRVKETLNPLFQKAGEMIKDIRPASEVEKAQSKVLLLERIHMEADTIFHEQLEKARRELFDKAHAEAFSNQE